jgi:8-oxo-dGTP pyrophosphatase MutT (NUDIX family)
MSDGSFTGEDPRPVRLAGRVIALDPANRVLLLRYNSHRNGPQWATPGGGVEAGEDFHAAATRELREETGWDDVEIAPDPVLEDARAHGPDSTFSRSVHRYFVARLPVPQRPVMDVDGMHASDGIMDSRWWSLAELESSGERVWPPSLLPVLRGLIGREERGREQ